MTALAPDSTDRTPTTGWEAIGNEDFYKSEHPRLVNIARLEDEMMVYWNQLSTRLNETAHTPLHLAICKELATVSFWLNQAPAVKTRIRQELLYQARRDEIEDQRAHARFVNDLRNS